MARSVTVYREVNGNVEKIDVSGQSSDHGLHYIGVEADNYHERIIKTYHELECQGKLRDMGPSEKRSIRDLHTHAQNPAYWPSDYTREERGV